MGFHVFNSLGEFFGRVGSMFTPGNSDSDYDDYTGIGGMKNMNGSMMDLNHSEYIELHDNEGHVYGRHVSSFSDAMAMKAEFDILHHDGNPTTNFAGGCPNTEHNSGFSHSHFGNDDDDIFHHGGGFGGMNGFGGLGGLD